MGRYVVLSHNNNRGGDSYNNKKNQLDLCQYDDFRKYSIEEISQMLGIGKTKTRELLQSRLLPVTKVGRDYFTSPQAIQEFLQKNIGKELYFKVVNRP